MVRSDSASDKKTTELYQTSGKIPFAVKLGQTARQIIYNNFLQTMRPDSSVQIVDIGVTSDEKYDASNFLEKLYPYKNNITCVGVEAAGNLEKDYPGLRFIQLKPHDLLPFKNNEFDIAFSNAVIEHVGTRVQQKIFISELCRVAKKIFIVAPNRFFPVEHHTGLPFLHYLPNRCMRPVIRLLGFDFWSREENLNLLYPWEFASLFPAEARIHLRYTGIGLGVFKSNILAYRR